MKNLLVVMVICLAASLAQASTLASYTFNSGYNYNSGDTIHIHTIGSLTWNAALGGTQSRPVVGTGNSCVQGSGFETGAAHDGSYWGVTDTITPGDYLNLTSLNLDIIRNGASSPTKLDVTYTMGGTTYSLGSWTPGTSWATYTITPGQPVILTGQVQFDFYPVFAGDNTQTLEIDNLAFIGTGAVPEPASLSLLGFGLFALFVRRKRK